MGIKRTYRALDTAFIIVYRFPKHINKPTITNINTLNYTCMEIIGDTHINFLLLSIAYNLLIKNN